MRLLGRSWYRSWYTVGCATLAITVASCGSGTSPADATDGTGRSLGSNGVPSLLECPRSTTLQTSGTISVLGGVLSLGGTSVLVPAGALLAPTQIVLTIPASPYMEIGVSVPGVAHFVFEKAIVVNIDYSRCQRSDLNSTPLQAWYIDSETKELLEREPSVDNKLTRTVTFTTGHLSGYALAN